MASSPELKGSHSPAFQFYQPLYQFDLHFATDQGSGALQGRHWQEVIPFFAYPLEVRKIIYTTNAIESLNMQVQPRTSESPSPLCTAGCQPLRTLSVL